MASISTNKQGNRRVQFVDGDGRRKSVYLGKRTIRAAETIKIRVQHLLSAKFSGDGWDSDTSRWVASLEDELAAKLAAVGLIPTRARSTVSDFTAVYVAGRTDTKPRTNAKLTHAANTLCEFLGANRKLQDVTPGDADDFRRWLGTKMGEQTTRRILGRAKQFFRAAVRKRLITESPFADMKGVTVQANKARDAFITRETALKVEEACPNVEWRLLFALARWGGLRVPSEVQALTWGDIDWERDRFRVSSIKTEHHEGHAERWVPIFPELRPHLEQAFHQAAEGAEFVIERHRDGNANLRTHMHRIIKRAGFTPWPKTFQNLRATRETELVRAHPIHVVCAWLGNSPRVAAAHYLQVTDSDFASATQKTTQTVPGDARQGATIENEKAHNSATAV